MQQFLSLEDVYDPISLAKEAIRLKSSPFADASLGNNKVLGMIFFNTSLRTRMSTTRAAYNLGMKVISLNVGNDSWQLEMEDGAVMDGGKAEHIKDAVPVMSQYCDILAVRSFAGLVDRNDDYTESTINAFAKYSTIPIVNMESATVHPLQSLSDLMTILERKIEKPKVVLTWAPHVRSLPQAVANSFSNWMLASKLDLTIAHPEGMDLDSKFTSGAKIVNDQRQAFVDADFIYVKNWSSYTDYGKVHNDSSWQVNLEKLQLTNNAKLMHCLPVRRNVVISDDALDSAHSIINEQANNRTYSAQVVLKKILENGA
ncbi:MAG: acetylornithine carbamoyltransferase [Cyclobacteriaceae bacterium]